MKKLRKLILKAAYPLIRFIALFDLPKRLITSRDYYNLRQIIIPGDVLLTRSKYSLANMLIPGKYKHGAMYVGMVNNIPTVIESVTEGVRTIPLIDFMLTKDKIKQIRPSFATKKQMRDAVGFAMKCLGKKYDYLFASGNEAMYCWELIWYAYDQVIKPSPFELRKRLGVETVTSDDFEKATDKWHVITVLGKI